MIFIRNFTHLHTGHRGCVATIGNFDGLHYGHQAVLNLLKEKARVFQLPTTAVIFEPQPQEFFSPYTSPPRLTRLREKLLIFRRFGIDRVLCFRFNKFSAAMPAEQFIRQILVEGLGIKYLIVGDDFHFGKGRQGNFHSLQAAGQHYGFEVSSMPTFSIDGRRVSSTWVREAMTAGDMRLVTKLLGRPYSLCGRIAHGDKRGRTLGFPTANVFLHRQVSPIRGVYAVRMHGVTHSSSAPGVANLGIRPTVDKNGTREVLEVHLFNFHQEIYGHYVEVEFVNRLREEQRFPSFDALQAQIQKDIAAARAELLLE